MEKKIMSHTDLVLELQQELEEDTSLLEGITVKEGRGETCSSGSVHHRG